MLTILLVTSFLVLSAYAQTGTSSITGTSFSTWSIWHLIIASTARRSLVNSLVAHLGRAFADPRTEIARLVARENVEVRKAEQGTRPKVFYVGADSSTLTPPLQRPATSYLWAQRPAEEADLMRMVAAVQDRGPGGDGTLSRPVYDVPHAVRPWGWRVSAYLWTKSIAAGALLVAALMGSAWWGGLRTTIAPAISLTFLLLTLLLLVVDLKRPDRFAYILLKSNWRSWLVWGAWILMAFGGAGGWWLLDGLRGASPPFSLTFLASSGMESGFMRTAIRLTPGVTSLSNSSHFPTRSLVTLDNPVTLPPGRAKLLTSPSAIGSPTTPNTIGTVVVACLAARAATVPPAVRMTSTLRATSSAARTGSRSIFPSAQRYSIRTLLPST
jgi:hypothetical protein